MNKNNFTWVQRNNNEQNVYLILYSQELLSISDGRKRRTQNRKNNQMTV